MDALTFSGNRPLSSSHGVLRDSCISAYTVTQPTDNNNLVSPDMNCIENLWASLKRRIGDRRCEDSRQEVIEIALDIWHNDNDFRELCLKLIQSMPKRVQTLYKAHGSQTKY